MLIELILIGALIALTALAAAPDPVVAEWTSPCRYRMPLQVKRKGKAGGKTPASVRADFSAALRNIGEEGVFDAHTVEVVAYDSKGKPITYDHSRPDSERHLLPHRIDPYYGVDYVTLNFLVPDTDAAAFAVYFDTAESGQGKPKRCAGLVGDGDYFSIEYSRREVGASHMDCFCDFDGDGDLDLFKCTNEPYIYCYENVGESRYVYRGRLASGGEVFTFPHDGLRFRSWPTIAFDDWDGDGDQDLFASFNDGPDAGHIVRYENVTKPGGQLTFEYRGRILTESGQPIGDRWFAAPTIVDWDNDGKKDLVVGREGRLEFYRNIGDSCSLADIRIADAVPIDLPGGLRMRGPRADFVDLDGDGDLDLFLTTQGGAVYYFENTGTRAKPVFADPVVVPNCSGGHDGVKVADFDGDGMLEYVVSSVWWGRSRLYKNTGTPKQPRWEEKDAHTGCPYTEGIQVCDAARQNTVRVVDWDNDGRLDLLACGERGSIKLYRNTTSNLSPLFADGVVLLTDLGPGVRCYVCDWNNDGRKDLLVTNWSGKVTLFLNQGTDSEPVLEPGQEILADGKPIAGNMWCSILVCDWDNDGRKDLIFGMCGEGSINKQYHWPHQNEDPVKDRGFLFFRNIGTDAEPVLAYPEWIEVGAKGSKSFDYLRPNTGSFVDWDGDGKKDFIVAEFENAIHLYRNTGSGKPGEKPEFADGGSLLVKATTHQIISGVDVVDWDGDGRLDIVTGQGHGGSSLRFYTRGYIEDCLHNTRPVVTAGKPERKG